MAPDSTDEDRGAKRKKTPRRKRDIVTTAVGLFNRFGFRRVTVGEICSEVGASKATFYKYFANKNELVKHLLGLMSNRYQRRVDEVESMDLPFIEKVRILVDDQLEQTRKTSDVFIQDFYRTNGELSAAFDELTAQSQRRFIDFIAKAQERGDVRPEIKHPFVLAMLGKLNEVFADNELRRQYSNYESFMREIVDFFFHGIFPADRSIQGD